MMNDQQNFPRHSVGLHETGEILAWEEWVCTHGVEGINFHLWMPSAPAIALGISQLPENELHFPVVIEDKCSIVRRPSGGGAVVLLSGVLAFGVLADPGIFSDKYAIHEAFDTLTEPVRKAATALTGMPKEAVIAGISDLAAVTPQGIRKFCGCAQMRKKHAVLVHGTILVNANIDLLERYLAWPSEVPDYRKGRGHRDFCVNLCELKPDNISVEQLAGEIATRSFKAGWNLMSMPDTLPEECAILYKSKYCSEDWNLRRKRP